MEFWEAEREYKKKKRREKISSLVGRAKKNFGRDSTRQQSFTQVEKPKYTGSNIFLVRKKRG